MAIAGSSTLFVRVTGLTPLDAPAAPASRACEVAPGAGARTLLSKHPVALLVVDGLGDATFYTNSVEPTTAMAIAGSSTLFVRVTGLTPLDAPAAPASRACEVAPGAGARTLLSKHPVALLVVDGL